jgi:hypothetical protein
MPLLEPEMVKNDRRCCQTEENPPTCGLHKVKLIMRQSKDDPTTGAFGDFVFYECPISKQIVGKCRT